MTNTLITEVLRSAVAGTGAAFRCLTRYQPVGGPGDKVFPPTYEGGRYVVEKRILDGGEIVDCELLDSVQSQATGWNWRCSKREAPGPSNCRW